jgi:hypothetical protein
VPTLLLRQFNVAALHPGPRIERPHFPFRVIAAFIPNDPRRLPRCVRMTGLAADPQAGKAVEREPDEERENTTESDQAPDERQ